MSDINKVVLAYSGGLDTSVIVRWLQDNYNCEVVTFTADIGQGEEVEPARAKAEALVHVSGIGVDLASESSYVRARAAGEVAVREAFPDATILRPSVLFGPEDAFFKAAHGGAAADRYMLS